MVEALQAQLFGNFLIDLRLKISEQTFIVIDLLFANLGLPLPKSVQVEIFHDLLNVVSLDLLVLVAHDLNHANYSLVILTSAHVLHSCEAGRKLAEAWGNLLFDLLDCSLRCQILFEVQVILTSQALGLVDESLHGPM